jgi:hypothetical protein
MRQTQHDRYLTLLLNLRRTWTSERIGFTNATYRAAYLPVALSPSITRLLKSLNSWRTPDVRPRESGNEPPWMATLRTV